MNFLTLSHSTQNIGENQLSISGSKSESNRIWVLKYLLLGKPLALFNSSNSEDTELMQKALDSTEKVIDIHHAGTAMRFLTAYFAVQEGRETILTGSSRMKERPIGILVDALRQLGADIEYIENEGFPPLKILGKKLIKNEVTLSANVSSQFISALLLIGVTFEDGLTIELEEKKTSLPYLNMTIEMLKAFDIEIEWKGINTLLVKNKEPQNLHKKEGLIALEKVYVESDWSSASYMYSILALAKQGSMILQTYYEGSLQGDKELVSIYKKYFNVNTIFDRDRFVDSKPIIYLVKSINRLPERIELNLNNCPDIAQTILVTAAALKIPFKLTGLHTLKIKETDRLIAMQTELFKIGAETKITDDSIESISYKELPKEVTISTYNDHRMAMAFAPLALKGVKLNVENHEVVNKSYPRFWNDLEVINFDITYP